MTDKLVAVNWEESKEFRKKHGWEGNNTPPPNLREISEEEFAQSHFFIYGPVAMDYEQAYIDPTKDRSMRSQPLVALKVFYMHDGTGYAFSEEFWEGKVHFYKWGCEHKYSELSIEECRKRNIYHAGRCWHVYECKNCGHIDAHDTSD